MTDDQAAPILVGESKTLGPAGSRRILVLKLDHLGDFIIGMPAMRTLRALFAGDHITLICGSWNLAAARESGLADEIVAYDYFDDHGWRGRPHQDIAVFDAAVKDGFDLAIDLRVDEDTRDLLRRVEATIKCGIGQRGRFPFLDVILPPQPKVRDDFSGDDNRAVDIDPDRFVTRLGPNQGRIHQSHGRIAKGHFIFGPYLKLPPGRFTASFGLSAQGAYVWPPAKLTVEVARDQVMLTSATVRHEELTGASAGPVLEFENDEDDPDENLGKFEFRVHLEGWAPVGAVQFSGVRLERVGAVKPRSRFRPVELHIGEQLSLLIELIRQRVLAFATAPAAIPVPSEPSEPVRRVASLPAGARIMVAPLSNKATCDWPLDRYARLVGLLLAQVDAQIVLLGARSQAEALGRIVAANDAGARIHNLAGLTSWPDVAELVAMADLVICNNSGIAHLAAGQGAPTLAIYSGAFQPQEWGPRGPRVRTLIAEVPCSPCGYALMEKCTHDFQCVKPITPEIVLDHALAMLAERVGPPRERSLSSGRRSPDSGAGPPATPTGREGQR
jgi:ADP-heptose:LPS heptosyltransferase